MKEKNQNSSHNGLDVDKIYVPYSTVERDIPPKDPGFQRGNVNDIVYVPVSLDEWQAAQDQVRAVLARNHRFDTDDKGALSMWDTVRNAQMVDGIFRSMTGFLGTIAVVTLTLGGVGVMNIMLVSVSERTREIGLRKALGARRRRILADFLTEGALLAFGSGAVGWLGSWSLAAFVNSFPMPEMFAGLPVRPSTTLIAFSALAVIAVASSLAPAWRAASLTPVEALRDER
jgi:putative ABC transport system permease protein